jgi:hypothetical protein
MLAKTSILTISRAHIVNNTRKIVRYQKFFEWMMAPRFTVKAHRFTPK